MLIVMNHAPLGKMLLLRRILGGSMLAVGVPQTPRKSILLLDARLFSGQKTCTDAGICDVFSAFCRDMLFWDRDNGVCSGDHTMCTLCQAA